MRPVIGCDRDGEECWFPWQLGRRDVSQRGCHRQVRHILFALSNKCDAFNTMHCIVYSFTLLYSGSGP